MVHLQCVQNIYLYLCANISIQVLPYLKWALADNAEYVSESGQLRRREQGWLS